uniref:Uncharacterized protein n=1 Tax=Meloidogyne enterolobii TaxID=390850 RepID=A0A6V7W8L0_MELEN|nr:unnamed protein product [Meloidogyne enterolobii]
MRGGTFVDILQNLHHFGGFRVILVLFFPKNQNIHYATKFVKCKNMNYMQIGTPSNVFKRNGNCVFCIRHHVHKTPVSSKNLKNFTPSVILCKVFSFSLSFVSNKLLIRNFVLAIYSHSFSFMSVKVANIVSFLPSWIFRIGIPYLF